MKLILTLLLCALLSPVPVFAADLEQPTPISTAETEQSSADSTELPSADSTEPPALDTIPSPDLTSCLLRRRLQRRSLPGCMISWWRSGSMSGSGPWLRWHIGSQNNHGRG